VNSRNDKAQHVLGFVFYISGGLGRNRTTDTRIFNVGCWRSHRFPHVPKLLIQREE
jgi:hypothetical protein